MQLVTIDDIRAAAELIRPYIVRTPFVPARWADDDRPLWIKPESLQPIGAFKVRGAFNAIGQPRRIRPDPRRRRLFERQPRPGCGVCGGDIRGTGAYRHAAAKRPHVKVAATRSHGAEVVLCGAGQREKVAAEVVEQTGGVLVPPFDHPRHHRGAGHDRPGDRRGPARSRHVLDPGQWRRPGIRHRHGIKALCPDARVFGVEPELAADTAEGLRLGHRVDWSIEDRNRTIADGLRSQPSELTFAHLQKVLDGVITVSESEIRAAVRELAYQAHLVAEPSGAVALAAYRKGATPPGRTVMILSGGNIEPPMLQRDPGRLTQAATTGSPRNWRRPSARPP